MKWYLTALSLVSALCLALVIYVYGTNQVSALAAVAMLLLCFSAMALNIKAIKKIIKHRKTC